MPLDPAANFVRVTTDASITNSATTLSVTDTSGFPDPSSEGEYNIVVWDVNSHPRPDQDPSVEIMRVTAVDGTNDDLTVSRGQESTSAASHPSGSGVHVTDTAKMFSDIQTKTSGLSDDGTTLSIGGLVATESESTAQSITAATTSGLGIAVAANGDVKTTDFTNYASDDAAIQALNDWIVNQSVPHGSIYLPHTNTNNTRLTIESTVTLGQNSFPSVVNVYFTPDTGQRELETNKTITTTINDGSAMFHHIPDSTNSVAPRGPQFKGGRFELGDNDAYIYRQEYCTDGTIQITHALDYAGGAIIIDGSQNLHIENSHLGARNTAAQDIVFRNSSPSTREDPKNVSLIDCEITGPTGDNVTTDGAGIRNLRVIGGHYERANGSAEFYFGTAPSIVVFDNPHLAATSNGAHHIDFDCNGDLRVTGGYFDDAAGDSIRIGATSGATADTVRISTQCDFENITGDSINLPTEPGNKSEIPYPEQIDGSVTYPGTPWARLRYPDGFMKVQEGSGETVPAGGDVTLTAFGGGADTDKKLQWHITTATDANVHVEEVREWNASADQPRWVLSETTGNGDAVVDWTAMQQ